MKIPHEEHNKLLSLIAGLRADRQPFWSLWRELADYYLPKRYVWLQSAAEARIRRAKNPYILDGTGTIAARVLAAGMMNGITSPSRPWFSLRVQNEDDEGGPITQWSDEVTRRMMLVMAESNFYNSMAVMYLDLVVFGTAASIIYEDYEDVIRCYNPALGEYYLGQSDRLAVNIFAREFEQTARQLVDWFGEENCSEQVKAAYKKGGAESLASFKVTHVIEPYDGKGRIAKKFAFKETYWETASIRGEILAENGFNEMPGVFPRWELTANDSYGTSPGMDALPDVIQLQLETKRKAQGIDKMINPPIIADVQLEHRPTALMPNGITYVAGANNIGAKPLYQITAPIQELTEDIRDVRTRIQEIFHNPLFNMISQLDTVRSATEIDARREEKLVLLGSVLERFENEALDPAIERIFNIMLRKGMLPDPPEGMEGAPIEIQYVSILSTAQRAVAAVPTERWIGLIGNVAGLVPSVLSIPDWDGLLRDYGLSIGVPAKNMKTREQVEEELAAQQQQAQEQQMMEAVPAAAQSAKLLSETDVGGGVSAIQQLLA